MTQLKDLQHHFQDFLLQGKQAITQHVLSTKKMSADARLEIYRHAYHSRLMDALAANYPALSIYLGEELFQQLSLSYLAKFPSTYRSIRWFGDQLAHFLEADAAYQIYPYLAEMAKFEWLMTMVFDAADSTVVGLEDVARIPPESWPTMRLIFHPSLQRLDLSWNVIDICQRLLEEKTLTDPVKNLTTIPWIIWRRDLISQFSSVTIPEAWAIDAVLDGHHFGEICEGLCQWIAEDEAGIYMASLLKGWVEAGLLAEIQY